MTDGMKVEHDLCRERRGGGLVGGKSRERRMHEPGMDDKPEGRERGRERGREEGKGCRESRSTFLCSHPAPLW